jgi:hypothetical protein
MTKQYIQTDYKNRQEYKLEYDIDDKTLMVKHIRMTKVIAWYWGIEEDFSVSWNIDLSNLPIIKINTYSQVDRKYKEVSEIQLKLNNLEKYPFYFTIELEDYLVEYEIKDLITKILEDIANNIQIYGLLEDIYRNR